MTSQARGRLAGVLELNKLDNSNSSLNVRETFLLKVEASKVSCFKFTVLGKQLDEIFVGKFDRDEEWIALLLRRPSGFVTFS